MTPTQEADVHRLASEGLSQRAIAKRLGTSHVTVGKVLRRSPPIAARAAAVVAAIGPEAPPIAVEPITQAGALSVLRTLVDENRAEHAACASRGDSQGAQRYSRTIAMLLPVLAREEHTAKASADTFSLPRSEIAEAMAGVQERVRMLCTKPVFCAGCSRRVQAAFGGVDLEPDNG